VTRHKVSGENWIKYEFNLSGASGKLKTVLIGDYLLHQDLVELDNERTTYQSAVENLKLAQSKGSKVKKADVEK